jgi:hypothetical protein
MIAFFIMRDAAAVLHAHGQTDIQTAMQAASALRQLAGEAAFLLFSASIIGRIASHTGFGGLSGVCSGGDSESSQSGCKGSSIKAWGYGTLCVATLLGVAMHITSINPIKALFLEHRDQWSRRRTDRICDDASDSESKADGTLRLPILQRIVGWAATAVVSDVAAGLIATWGLVMWNE